MADEQPGLNITPEMEALINAKREEASAKKPDDTKKSDDQKISPVAPTEHDEKKGGNAELTYKDAVELIEGKKDEEHSEMARSYFRNRLKGLRENDYEGRGGCYYYMLRINLQGGIRIETEAEKSLYKNMDKCYKKQEKEVLAGYKDKTNPLAKFQLIAFYKLMEGYYGVLEELYDKHDIIDAVERAYESKMDFRKDRFMVEKNWFKWFEYFVLKVTCRYGNSFARWGFTGIFFVCFFATMYYLFDLNHEMISGMKDGGHWYDYLYYSMVTFTTLGYGDVLPVYWPQKLFAAMEVFLGYIQLGLFLTLIQKKL